MLSKNVNNKKCAPKFVFFNGKKIRKIRMIFDFERQISTLFDTSPLQQFSKFNDVIWLQFIFSQKNF
jgi:hypothetical protein